MIHDADSPEGKSSQSLIRICRCLGDGLAVRAPVPRGDFLDTDKHAV